jgi:Rieske Fe-S protein
VSSTATDPGRRTFLKRLAAALGAFLGAAAGVPLVGAIVAPGMRRDEPHWVPVGAAVAFAIGQPRMITFGIQKTDGYVRSTLTRAIWVCRQTEDQFAIYNARCTHLGCLVSYRPDSQTFLSPCHAGVFALRDGHVLEGPPPRPLDRLDYRVDDGQVVVQYRDFLVGVPDQVPL